MFMFIKSKIFLLKPVLFFLILSLKVNLIFAQKSDLLVITDSLNNCFSNIINEQQDENKLQLNNSVIEIIKSYLGKVESFNNPLSSVKNIGLIQSSDKKLNIYTWNIPLNDGTHKYFGFIHYSSKKKKQNLVFELVDKSNEIKNPERALLNCSNWYGALYYKIVETKYKGITYYALLASDLNNLSTKKKIVDVLFFDTNDQPVFGATIFNQPNQFDTRLIFEFNVRANMTLNYDQKLEMIVFDHLSPSKPNLVGIYEFYGPDFSYDGLKFKKGKWNLFNDIEVKGDK